MYLALTCEVKHFLQMCANAFDIVRNKQFIIRALYRVKDHLRMRSTKPPVILGGVVSCWGLRMRVCSLHCLLCVLFVTINTG